MHYKTFGVLAVLSLMLTCTSTHYKSSAELRIVRSERAFPQPPPRAIAGGFPIPYLVDKPGVSVEHHLTLGDEFRPGAFALDSLIYFGLGLLIVRFVMHYKTVSVLAALSLTLACTSIFYKSTELRIVHSERASPQPPPQSVPAIAAGFPIPFLVDKLDVSVVGTLSLGEDEFRPGAFAIDSLIYFGIGLLIVRFVPNPLSSSSKP